MEKRWVLKHQYNSDELEPLAKELNISLPIANLLFQRGIITFEDARNFFRPELKHLHDPFLMKDMGKAVERIEKAIENNERIIVYGDYDVDGTSAVALVYSFLKNQFQQYNNIDFYIPDRYNEGYGISEKGIDFAVETNTKLIIALDCGIKEIDKIAYANSKGIDFIVCDHHRPGIDIPVAFAVLDPKRPDCDYPYKELSGCGIGFKLIQAICQKKNIKVEELKQYLDLVVVSIASDIVPITGENRVLAYYGLKLINSNPRPGIEAVLQSGGIKRIFASPGNEMGLIFSRELNINDLVFLIGPRINAAGRIESGRNSVELLIADNLENALTLGTQIDNYNTERRTLDSQTTIEAIDMVKNEPDLLRKKTTVVYNANWHKGIIGIVASRLTENFYRPTIVLTNSNGLICGSARSVKDFDIYDAIDACSGLLEHFGGHKYAAGLTLKPENLHKFINKFEEIVSKTITEEMQVPEVEIDSELDLRQINLNFFKIIKQFSPFGPGNMSPVFLTKGVVDFGNIRLVGKNDKHHLKLSITYPEISLNPFPAIAFQLADFYNYIHEGNSFDICYHIEENEWNGLISLQLNIKDIKESEPD
ncbi:MAG: single-stranded-DNA-specific exonuclease RecJ [Bacteroidales bacterium]|jgi:single-stranded-DNA-specific exonuclease|nr:single-stranded-DNA-specific exonuclease RecJ [Bacteroidales bacterium]MDD4215004.1 single-stranded-DNA-specific exonuclease RecJ [Bacteroidales bacterium]